MMKTSIRRSRPWPWFAVLSTSVAATQSAHALEPEDLLIYSRDPVVIRPQLDLSQSYVDNIFFRDATKEDDFISVVAPGINLQLGRDEGNYLRLGYTHEEVFYWDQSDLNTSQDFVNLTGFIQSGRLTIEGADSFSRESSVLSGSERAAIDGNVDRIRVRDDYRFTVDLTEKTEVYATGRYAMTDYEDDVTLFDQNEWELGTGFGFDISEDLTLFGEGFYGQTAVHANSPVLREGVPSEFLGGFMGARGDFTPNLTGSVKAGYEYRRFFDDDVDSISGPAVETGLQLALGPKNAAAIEYTRRTGVSVQFAGQSYVADQVSLRYLHYFGQASKWLATASGSYVIRDYESSPFIAAREDDLLITTAALNYAIQEWLLTSLSYTFQLFESDVLTDYDAHQVTLSLNVGY